MEVRINSEVRDFEEGIIFGLSLKQLVFAALAVASSVLVYLLTKGRLNLNISGILCVIAAAPWAAAGFVRINGLSVGGFLAAWLRFCATPRRLVYDAGNLYLALLAAEDKSKTREDKQL